MRQGTLGVSLGVRNWVFHYNSHWELNPHPALILEESVVLVVLTMGGGGFTHHGRHFY